MGPAADRARHHAAVGRTRRAARDVRDRRGLARAPRPEGGGDAAAARRDVLGRPCLLGTRPRRRRPGDRDDAQRGEEPPADRARRRGRRARGRRLHRARPGLPARRRRRRRRPHRRPLGARDAAPAAPRRHGLQLRLAVRHLGAPGLRADRDDPVGTQADGLPFQRRARRAGRGTAAARVASKSSAAQWRRTSTRSIRSSTRSTRTAGWQRTRRPASSSCCRTQRPLERPRHGLLRRPPEALPAHTPSSSPAHKSFASVDAGVVRRDDDHPGDVRFEDPWRARSCGDHLRRRSRCPCVSRSSGRAGGAVVEFGARRAPIPRRRARRFPHRSRVAASRRGRRPRYYRAPAAFR